MCVRQFKVQWKRVMTLAFLIPTKLTGMDREGREKKGNIKTKTIKWLSGIRYGGFPNSFFIYRELTGKEKGEGR